MKIRPCSINFVSHLCDLLGPVLQIFTYHIAINLLNHVPWDCSRLYLLCVTYSVLSQFGCEYTSYLCLVMQNFVKIIFRYLTSLHLGVSRRHALL